MPCGFGATGRRRWERCDDGGEGLWRSSLWQARLMEKWGRKKKEEEKEEERVTAAGMEEGDGYHWV